MGKQSNWKGKGSEWKRSGRSDNEGGMDDRRGGGREREEGKEEEGWAGQKHFQEPHPGSISMDVIKASEEYKERYISSAPKKKYAVCVGYLGTNYQGLQINPDAITVESILEKALFLCGGMDEANFGNLQKLQWSRAARTDRGVHAVSQCCSMKLTIALDADPQTTPTNRDEFIRRVNKFLPDDIRVLAVTRVTKNFNAKLFCSKRRYQYYLPTYMLKPIAEINELLAEAYSRQGPVKGAGYPGGFSEPNNSSYLGPEFLAQVRELVRNYRASSEQLETFRGVLKRYAGTNSFHNFTTGKTPNDTNARRYIVSFDCGPAEVDPETGIEWVLLSVVGQSFLLNQIRKMVGYAVDVLRGAVSAETQDVALSSRKVEIPLAPGQGLYLDELYFEGYNMKMAKVNEVTLQTLKKSKPEPSSSSSSSSAPCIVESQAKEAESGGAVAAADDDEGPLIHELLDWATSAAPALLSFKTETLHPHVKRLESDLPFLYYLDYLRVHRHHYTAKDFTYDDRGNNKKRGRNEKDKEDDEGEE